MMAVDLSRALDPVLLANDCGITPDPWQAELLRDIPRRGLLLCSRQSGKTTTVALACLATACFLNKSLSVVFSPSQRQSAEFLRTVLKFYRELTGVPSLTMESTLRAEFANGSRILALPGSEKTVRGYAGADLLVIDEAARVDDELIAAIRPMMATKPNGKLIALTTPAGKRGWFYEAWVNSNDWTKVRVAASDCPRISQQHLDEELRSMGQMRFDEEYNLIFTESLEAVFPVAVIEAAFSSNVRPLWA